MKYSRITILIIFILLIGGVILIAPHTAHAETTFIQDISNSVINGVLAGVANSMLGLTSWFVTITGTFLNTSLYFTTHIRDLYNSLTSIQSIWITVRDLSSLFIIFLLLYSAIRMIIGDGGAGFGKLVVKIFIAGILINFSLFFVRVAIDVSNIVSLQFYEAIAPQQVARANLGGNNLAVNAAFFDGGLSNIFMNSLRLPTIYNQTGVLTNPDVTFGIFLAATGGIIMMITAGFSFLAASIAFTLRTAILLFAMALSPLLFLGALFPGIPVGNLQKLLKGQLIFMPVYLGLMYIALRVISDKNFMSMFNQGGGGTNPSEAFGAVSISIIIQYTIAIIFINFPLATAISMSGTNGLGMKWAPTAKSVAGTIGGYIGRNFGPGSLVNKASRGIQRSLANSADKGVVNKFVANSALGAKILQGAKTAESWKYGSTKSRKDAKEEAKKLASGYASTRLESRRESLIDKVHAHTKKKSFLELDEKIRQDYTRYVSGMSTKQLSELDEHDLNNKTVLTRLSSKQFDELVGEKNLDISEETKEKIKDTRNNALIEFLSNQSNSPADIKEVMKKLSGKELTKLKPPPNQTNPIGYAWVMDHLTGSQLKDMEENDLSPALKNDIANYIISAHQTKPLPGGGFFSKPAAARSWRYPAQNPRAQP